MKKIRLILLGLFALTMFGCTSENDFQKAKRQLEQQGYTNVTKTGYKVFCCSDEDDFSTGFEATDKQGNKVTGCACSKYLKGVTIRLD